MKKFVAVAGNIGVGKSTLVGMLCAKLGWEPFYEPVAENPYLADFYRDMNAWSFHSQVFFLTHRLKAHHELSLRPAAVIQDRSVYEDAEIFAQNLFLQGHIRPRDYQTYRELYQTLIEFLPPPDLDGRGWIERQLMVGAQAVGQEEDLRMESPGLHIFIKVGQVGVLVVGLEEGRHLVGAAQEVGQGALPHADVAGDGDVASGLQGTFPRGRPRS